MLCLAGCGGSNVVVTEVLNHHSCQLRTAGIRQIDHADLPTLRGARLLLEPDATEPDLQGDASRVLVVISRGPQPTPGYGLELLGASQEVTDIHLQYAWTEPDDHTMLAQVITHPCSVVELDDATADSLAGLSIGASIAEEQLTALQLQ